MIIEPASGEADAAVVGEISHIYASADTGPRGKPGLTPAERDAHDNLILLCAHHHTIVDKQYAAYPAGLLREWKAVQTSARTSDPATDFDSHGRKMSFYLEAADREIERQSDILRMSRLYSGFALKERAVELAKRVEDGELSGGSHRARGRALAYCARVLVYVDADTAGHLLSEARKLAGFAECEIAQATLLSRSDSAAGIAMLAKVDTPSARTAMFRILQMGEGAARALDWLLAAGLQPESLDSDGRFFVIAALLDTGQWSAAKECAEKLTQADFDAFPALYHVAAMSHLMTVVPDEMRAVVRTQVPLGYVPLMSEAAHQAAQRKAAALFSKSSDNATLLGVAAAANCDADFSLWLRLQDRDERPGAREELEASMLDPVASLRRVHLAIQYNVKFDREEIERRIDRSVAFSGQGTADEAFARLSLALAAENPKDAVEAVERSRALLYAHLNPQALCMMEVEFLSRAGMVAVAETRMEEGVKDGLGPQERVRLERMIAEAKGADPLAMRRRQYEQTRALADLAVLVDALEERELWREIRPLAEELYGRTRALVDGRRLAHVLDRLGDVPALLVFLEAETHLVSQIGGMDGHLAWTLYRAGRFDDARAALGRLRARRDDASDRVLLASLAIHSGRWVDLIDFTTGEWTARDFRTPEQLLWAGQLAQVAGGPVASELITEAARRAPDDATTLASAYFHAVGAGWQGDEFGGWLQRAAELSGDDGPIQSVSFEQLIDMKPDWAQRASSTWQMLSTGEIPLFGAASLLNSGLLELVLMPSLANLSERDLRRRSVIYAFSGARTDIERKSLKRIALDVSALLTLARLSLLKRVVETYEILISHGTLGWLFVERQKATFHQPSRIREAHTVRRLLAQGDLRVLKSGPQRDTHLDADVGVELASLLSTAADSSAAARPRVVRSAPVYNVGSLMREEADLSAFAPSLCSCAAVVARLRASGVLAADEERQARNFLRIQERQWPEEVPIEDGAELYLDSLSVHYLYSVGVLDRLAQAGITAFISPWTDNETNLLISREVLGAEVLVIIDAMRRVLADGIANKTVHLTTAAAAHANVEEKLHPTLDVLNTSDVVDAFLVDDRFVNRHLWLEGSGGRTPILTSLDLIDDLRERGLITDSELYAHRAFLRRAGYQLVELRREELIHHIEAARAEDGSLLETSELRATREAFLKVRMTRMLQIPLEVPWLHQSLSAVIQAIKRVWQIMPQDAEPACEPLLALLEVEGWAQSTLSGNPGPLAVYLKAAHTMSLLLPPEDVPEVVSEAYQGWFEKRILDDIEQGEPEVFSQLINQAYQIVRQALSDEVSAEIGDKLEIEPSILAGHLLRRLSPRVRRAIIYDHASELGLRTDALIAFGTNGPSFQRSTLYEKVRGLPPDHQVTVIDNGGAEWFLRLNQSGPLPSLEFQRDGQRFASADLLFLVGLPDVRISAFEILVAQHGLPNDAAEGWRAIISARALDDDETMRFSADLQATPPSVQAILKDRMATGEITLDQLIPSDLRYYERLVGVCPDDASLAEYFTSVAAPLLSDVIKKDPARGYARALLLGSHSRLASAAADLVPASSFKATVDWAQHGGDLMAQTAILEALIARPDLDVETSEALARLVETVTRMDAATSDRRYGAFAILIHFVFGTLAHRRSFAQKPPYWRRAAALGHAALIERCFLATGGDINEFAGFLRNYGGRASLLQSYVDLRRGPRGLPVLFAPRQLRNEFGYRIVVAAQSGQAVNPALCSPFLGDGPDAFRTPAELQFGMAPGPIEGGIDPVATIPDSDQASLLAGLAGSLTLDALEPVAALSLIFFIPADFAEEIAEMLARNGYRLEGEVARPKLVGILTGLALIAAAARCRPLSSAMFELLRNLLDSTSELAARDIFSTAMISAAAYAELPEWCQCVGTFFSQIGLRLLTKEEAREWHGYLRDLCHLVPELWSTCAQAEAALQSVAA